MIKKIVLPFLCAAILLVASAHATTGIFGGYIVLNINGGGSQFYKLENPNDNVTPSYNGINLGTFDPSVNSLFLTGGEADTFKNSGGDVTDAALNYRIYLTGNASGGLISLNLPFNQDLGNGDQKWQTTAASTNVLNGLPNGNYTLETFVSAGTNEGARFLSNGGANYVATFTVVPEPATVSLLAGPAILGAWFFVRRRRS